MRYVSLENVQQGEKLGKQILSNDGRIMLSKGVQLTVGLISKLRAMGVSALFIEDTRFDDIVIEEVVSETTKRETMKTLANSVQFLQQDKPLNGEEISNSVDSIIEEIMGNHEVLMSITDIRTKENEIFVHLLNVCILSTMIGVKLNLNRERIQELAIGAILHDIGKLIDRVPLKDIPSGYSGGEEELKHHSWKGFNVLRKSSDISTLSAHIALAHHEYVDGSGLPRGMQGEDIHFLAKIVAVTNDYDRLITHSDPAEKMFPHEAGEYIMSLTGKRYDHNVVWRFLRSIAFYPNGTQVKLSTNQVGVVTGQHKGLPQRPIIRVYDGDEESFTFEEVDLAVETTVFISKVYD
ncbi:HD-GYP domain-containing protein [Alkalicoccus daliensis]|uniref:HD-GYP domain, c-di-GMP phosphodiesterase class II (Or its inactivated variant) n=1 Tax=Alkalicoccus daliensis TaxID=745820 RepID=A0A1G9ZR36_9BACI|nr:HD domain-containing phosphohydrolase [Alkalicoccus daliensis]SDN23086.1 HD-GYP domain, c-di-GMP phosphodiesterase class II (or its inactivated variant) [Alkalicoccus daliensis]